MKIPKAFSEGLTDLYEGRKTFNQFIKEQQEYIRRLVTYANRYSTEWMSSDDDDLFQEACLFLVRAVWEWEEDYNISLDRYVVYNIGARLKTEVRNSRAQKRHPVGSASKRDIWSPVAQGYSDDGSLQLESVLHANQELNPETQVATREAFEQARADMTSLAYELTVVLIEEGGNLASATRRLYRRRHIKKRFLNSENYLGYWLKEKILPEIFEKLSPMDIIPGDTGNLSNG